MEQLAGLIVELINAVFLDWKRVKLNLYSTNFMSQSTGKEFNQSKMVTALHI